MRVHRSLRLLLLVLGLALLLPLAAQADAGPKPGMKFTFRFQGQPVAILSGQLIECDDAACTKGEPLPEIGPQRMRCEGTECSVIAYGFKDYHKLVIQFADRTRESNVFSKRAYNAAFDVTVTETSLTVRERPGLNMCCPCFPAALLTIFAELGVAALYVSLFRLPTTLLRWVPLASLLTLPLVWFVFPRLPAPAGSIIIAAEVCAVGAEAILLYALARRKVPWRHAAALSLAMNAVSFAAGLALLPAAFA
jgi:hypothetical protein